MDSPTTDPAGERPAERPAERPTERPTERPIGGPIGVLLVNVGSPDAPTPSAVRRYLDEFLGDPLVVDLNPVLWWLIRKGIVLPLRGRTSAALYRSVWRDEGSPLILFSQAQRAALEVELGSGFRVVLAMRYGNPSITAGLAELSRAGCRRLILVPMFPQYSRATNLTVEREVARLVAELQEPMEVTVMGAWYEDDRYIEALAEQVREGFAAGEVDQLVLSFHGLPERLVEAGDPYRDHCEATARRLAEVLELEPERWTLVYQSRFGREKWLGPAAIEAVPALAARCPRVLVVTPGFAADCLETLEEIAGGLRKAFVEAGGRELRVLPCLNDRPTWMRALAQRVRELV